MEKKFRFSNKPLAARILYASVIAILCITAIVVGIVSAASRNKDNVDELPPADSGNIGTGDNNGNDSTGEEEKPAPEKPLAFVSPLVGKVVLGHDLETPVFSNTLGEWRVHTGVDISAEEGAAVYASEAGTVSGIYKDPMMGYTVEITHKGDIVTRYSNLDEEASKILAVGDTVESGDKIGQVGDSAVKELAEEPHLHFELLYKGVKMNPLDYLTEDSKSASLGIGKK